MTVIKFEPPDRPENVEALSALVAAVRAAIAIGFDREKFIRSAGLVFDGVVLTDLTEKRGTEP